jgi:hypothetical protein
LIYRSAQIASAARRGEDADRYWYRRGNVLSVNYFTLLPKMNDFFGSRSSRTLYPYSIASTLRSRPAGDDPLRNLDV